MQPKKVIVFQGRDGCRNGLTNCCVVGWVSHCSFPECWQNNNFLFILIVWNVTVICLITYAKVVITPRVRSSPRVPGRVCLESLVGLRFARPQLLTRGVGSGAKRRSQRSRSPCAKGCHKISKRKKKVNQ